MATRQKQSRQKNALKYWTNELANIKTHLERCAKADKRVKKNKQYTNAAEFQTFATKQLGDLNNKGIKSYE